MKNIPNEILDRICFEIDSIYGGLNFKDRGIKIDEKLIKATLEILNDTPNKTLPQNCRNDIKERCIDGLDKRIKEYMKSDLRTANIVSDILAEVGVVEVIKIENLSTKRLVKATRLLNKWCW